MSLTGRKRHSTRILCYGDSNTWGYEPLTGKRYKRENRWTGVLDRELGGGYTIIEQGLNGRTTVCDEPGEFLRNGGKYLPRCLESFKPLDLVIIFLGTNDLKHRFALSAGDIARGAGQLVDIVQQSVTGRNGNPPYVLLLAPPPVGRLTKFAGMFKNAQVESKKLGKYYNSIADEKGCFFMDTATVIKSSDLDGIHLEKKQHTRLGKSIAEFIRDMKVSVLQII
ncbi:SGNH/GDSL hydrolase family protein [candidate division KSB1 bacterium]|nr:SGNH/GDSL hydrolase family protein [candidate division KSB1 bacterium]